MSQKYTIVNGELYHYGVKGMKWGRRKAKAATADAEKYRNMAQRKADSLNAKGKTDKADLVKSKYEAKAQRAELKAKRLEKGADFQKKQADVAASRSTGHKLATNLIAGPFANRTYNSVIAAGGSRRKAIAVTLAANALGGPLGHIAVASLYRHEASRKE